MQSNKRSSRLFQIIKPPPSVFWLMIVLAFPVFNCNREKTTPEYPDFIVRHALEENYDKAKWELYKLNCLPDWNSNVDFLIGVTSAEHEKATRNRFFEERDAYKGERLDLYHDEDMLKEIFGEENVTNFLEFDLVWFKHDTLNVFANNEIRMVFFPKHPERDSVYYQKYGVGHYYTIIFEKDSIIGTGLDDYFEFGYSINDAPDQEFIDLVRKSEVRVNPWIWNYMNTKKMKNQKSF